MTRPQGREQPQGESSLATSRVDQPASPAAVRALFIRGLRFASAGPCKRSEQQNERMRTCIRLSQPQRMLASWQGPSH